MADHDYPPLPLPIAGLADPVEARGVLATTAIPVPEALLAELAAVCTVDVSDPGRLEAGRDWWPLALHWAQEGRVPAVPAAVARPTSTAEVAEVVRRCVAAGVPVTPAAGRSGVCGGSVPKAGGVSLDLRGLDGIVEVQSEDLLVRARAGTNGLAFEEALRRDHGLTVGHWPQSMALSSVGGWVACRGAGQYSTRYGKVEDLVAGLEVVLADGSVVRTGGRAPRSAVGPDLTQLFTGSEGTLGVVTEVTLKARPVPEHQGRQAWMFPTFAAGLEACRLALRAGATPAVLRLYDGREGRRFGGDGEQSVLLVLDEAAAGLVEATLALVASACEATGGTPGDVAGVAAWLEHRNDVSGLGTAVQGGVVVDTCEIAAPWSALPGIHTEAERRFKALPGAAIISCHQSHAYLDGACLYFTFAGFPEAKDGAPGLGREGFYAAAWDAVTGGTLDGGGALSHHHGVGLLRARFVERALGSGAFGVLSAVKAALDPTGLLNPGGLGLAVPGGPRPLLWP